MQEHMTKVDKHAPVDAYGHLGSSQIWLCCKQQLAGQHVMADDGASHVCHTPGATRLLLCCKSSPLFKTTRLCKYHTQAQGLIIAQASTVWLQDIIALGSAAGGGCIDIMARPHTEQQQHC
jgi:hypothetical protein